MIIKHPEASDLPQLRSLWQEAFADTDAYLDAFFETAFAPTRCLTLWKQGRLAAALYWLRCRCREQPCAYLYAVATAKEFRGQGLCHALMEHTHALLRSQGYAMAVLVPGDSSLFALYASMGYACFGGMDESLHSAAAAATELRQISAEEYARLRRRLLPEGGIVQEAETLALLQTQARFYAGENALVCAQRQQDTLFVPELLGSADPGSIVQALQCRGGTFRRSGSSPFAMWLGLQAVAPPEYFSFALD